MPANSSSGQGKPEIIPSRSKNFGLTPESFDRLLQELKRGDETLFQTIFLAHFQDCIKFISNKYGLQHEKAYDITMDALLLFRRRLLEGKISYGNIRFLFTRMAGQIYLKQANKEIAKVEISEIQGLLNDEDEELDSETLEAFNQAWEQLGTDCRGLLKRFYYYKATLKEIAEEQQKTAAALRKQKQRCIEKLRHLFYQFYEH